MLSYFTYNQIIPFFISVVILCASIISFHLNKHKISLYLLFIGSLTLGYFIANLDPYLMIWDEQYHALVAKNMLTNPFKPMLFNTPVLPYDHTIWADNHIWLHKQPLFLWQIAASLKLFGINEMAVRIPSILMHAIIPIFIYRIGCIIQNKTIGFYGGLFFCVCYYPLESVAGRYCTDHNDVAFIFYVTASLWSWFEYSVTQKKYWLVLIGLFSGCAILVKWLTGLLVYALWFISIGIEDKKKWLTLKSYKALVISFLITLCVSMPWQIFILLNYPLEANYEFDLNSKHFFTAIEGHGGDVWFHFDAIYELYGSGYLVPHLILIGLIFLIIRSNSKTYKVVILSAVTLVYLFFTLVATKMLSFCLIVSPFIFLSLGALVNEIIVFSNNRIKLVVFNKTFPVVLTLLFCIGLLNLNRIKERHTFWEPSPLDDRPMELKEMAFIEKLKQLPSDKKYVVFHQSTHFNNNIPIMFYTNCIAYHLGLDQYKIDLVKKQNYTVVVDYTDSLPSFIRDDASIIKIK